MLFAAMDGLLLVAALSVCGLNKEEAWMMDGLFSCFHQINTNFKYINDIKISNLNPPKI